MAATASSEQWNVRICLPGSAPTVKTLTGDAKVPISAGFNLELDTRVGSLRCYDTDAAHPWLSIKHPEPCTNAHFDLDLRNLPAGFGVAAAAAASAEKKKRSKKRKAESDPNGAPAAKKPKVSVEAPPAAGTDAPVLDTAPKKKRPPSTKGRKKAPAAESGDSRSGGAASQYQDDLGALVDELGILDS